MVLEDMAADSLDAGCSGDAAAAAHTDASDLPAEQRTRRRAPGKVGALSSDWCCGCAMGRGGKLPPWLLVAIFIYCNLLNYVDRGIVNAMLPQYCVDCRAQPDAESCNAVALCDWQASAAACGFNSSVVPRRGIGGTLQVNKTDQGVIAGSFMGGYCVFSPIFAYLSTVHKPFTLMGLGLLAWCAACGLASAAPTFGAFILARVVSGIGEASFQCIAPCFIDDSAPAAIKGKVLAAFFMAVPIGQALGYAYGGFMCSELDPSVLGFDSWRLAFALEGVAMMPVALLCFCVTNRLKAQDTHDGRDAAAGEAGSVTGRGGEGGGICAHAWELVLDIVSNGIWLCTTLGYAGYTFSVGAIAVWVPSFLQQPPFGIALERADVLFGSIAVVTGLLGTLGGGLLLDICTRVFGLETIEASLLLTVVLMIAAWPICFVAFTTTNFSIFVSCMFVGQLFAFATTSPVNGVLLWCVPSTTRTLSMALSVLAMHLLGDVPSPVVVGAMFEAMPDHPSRVMQIVASLMGVAVLFWTLAWLLARTQNARRRAAEQENDVEGTGVPLLSAR